jgi:hypothetical protein
MSRTDKTNLGMKVLLAIFAAVALTACSTGDGHSADYHKGYSAGKTDTTLLDTTPIDSACVVLSYAQSGSVSADWFAGCHDGEHARGTG